jgi:uncharacterized heparinase superfamily protein
MLTLAQRPVELFGSVKRQAGISACGTSFYHWLLSKGNTPSELNIKLTDPWPGQADVGRMMTHGVFVQQGMSLKIDSNFWHHVDGHESWQEIIHSFAWLRDLRAAGGDASRKLARQIVEDWLDKYDRWDATIWRADIMGQRIAMWISFYDFFCSSADENFQKKYFASLNRQARHLARSISSSLNLSGIPLLRATEGLIYAGLSLSEEDNWTLRGFEIVLREIPKQIRKDGSHISGSPENILNCAQILLDLRYALNRANLPVPKTIQTALERMGVALRFFTYPDHKLALFHGGQEGVDQIIDTTLSQIRTPKRAAKTVSIGGFERANLGKAVLIIDTSTVPEPPYNKSYHSAPLAFEFAYGKDRIFTNCGGHAFNPDWQQGLRHSAAHNTLILNNRPVHDFLENGEIAKPHGPICSVRRESKDACLIDVSHDAFRANHGIDHKRRFFLSNNGQDLRGEDSLLAKVPLSKPAPVTLRFHLHPRVQVASLEDNGDVIFSLTGGTSWRFCAVGAEITLDTSVFLGSGTKPIKSRQIVLSADMTSDFLQIKWALQRV